MNIDDYSISLTNHIFSCHESAIRSSDQQLMYLCSSFISNKTIKFWLLPNVFQHFNPSLYAKASNGIFNSKTRGLKPNIPPKGSELNHVILKINRHHSFSFQQKTELSKDNLIQQLQYQNEFYKTQIQILTQEISQLKNNTIHVFDEQSLDEFIQKLNE